MKNRLSIFALFGILAAGCTSTELRHLNQDLVAFYEAKKSDDPLISTAAEASLATLAGQAADQAPKAKETATKISLLRISATAAWQAKDVDAMSKSDPGRALCEEEENVDLAPRDCGMLQLFPIFLATDATTATMNACDGNCDWEEATSQYLDQAQLLMLRVPDLSDKSSPDFVVEVTRRAEDVFMFANRAYLSHKRDAGAASPNVIRQCNEIKAIKAQTSQIDELASAAAKLSDHPECRDG